MTILRWELNEGNAGDKYKLSTDDADNVRGVSISILNNGNERRLNMNAWLCPSDAKTLGKMLIAASDEVK